MKPDLGPVAVCATCGTQKPVGQLGRYDDTERAFCLQRDGHGGQCYRERVTDGDLALMDRVADALEAGAPSLLDAIRQASTPVTPRPIAALPAQSGAFVEMAP